VKNFTINDNKKWCGVKTFTEIHGENS